MAYLLRTLVLIMVVSVALTAMTALHFITMPMGHIYLAIPTFLYTVFAQAFVMFYFIGVSRLSTNVFNVLQSNSKENLRELFDEDAIPSDLTPYRQKAERFVYVSTLSKRQTIPWTMLMLILGTIGFLLGGAHDTALVPKIVHSGVIYGFITAMLIGSVRQWYYLGKAHQLLRELKALFSLSDDAM